MSFDSRFGGRAFHVVLPLEAVLAVYARESGAGLAFQGSNVSGSFTSPEAHSQSGTGAETSSAQPVEPQGAGSLATHDSAATPRQPPRGRPTLTVIE